MRNCSAPAFSNPMLPVMLATGIEHDHDGDRPHLVHEDHNLLHVPVVEDFEILLGQVTYQAVVPVRDRHVEVDDIGARRERRSLLPGPAVPPRRPRVR